ncbi:hypothetical protein K491DRAFT_692976 [Lophiostoma macrostomum CBS 122681]|uniref:Mid2 domain-containing protein n=1 Tax=Lophiostoma macrostomum CBS 122681 TaxID=1314788 RepID=A0A6A6T6K0_9PLEO|nr:hypothetical protein K491DRAFT_692976 [Lophiostoma macrostomum CBS 122681]
MMNPSPTYTLFLLLLLPSLITTSCYFPDGSTTQDTPCNPKSANSTCCGPGYACLSNHLCSVTSQVPLSIADLSPYYVRASCTDPTWTSTECPQFCTNATNGDNLGVGGMGVGKCDGNASLDRYYCRDERTKDLSDGVLCGDQEYYFGFEGFPTTVTVIGGDSTSTPSTTSTTAPASSQHPVSSGDNRVALGAGLGVGLGVPLLLAFGVITLLWSRSRPIRVAELGAESLGSPSPIAEGKVASQLHEVHSDALSRPHELPGKDPFTAGQ